ncbi:MAG: hypothetical protein ACMUHU_05935 [Thermoplasmatota archaeon]
MEMDWTFDMPTLLALATLIFVVLVFIWEQGQVRKQMMIQNFSEYTRRYQEVILNLPLEISSPKYDIGSLKGDEREKVMKWMRVYFDICAEEYLLFKRGLIDREVWEDWLGGMKETYKRPAFKAAWKEFSKNPDIYNKFKPFVEKEIIGK